ncbi:MAG: hypothetical protein LCI00_27640 [Chloroflexi bacterium]|nr:hypothetical protein [Chloroflexota bacterium]MCC6897264.1 hypothetical protein [Anaerolineae bacterium]
MSNADMSLLDISYGDLPIFVNHNFHEVYSAFKFWVEGDRLAAWKRMQQAASLHLKKPFEKSVCR